MKQYYELKDSTTFETVFFGTEDEIEAYLDNPDHNGSYEIWKADTLNQLRRNTNADDNKRNR